MSISPGSRLGPYEILAPIGAGGMGEVYRARDTRLERHVAVKVLPESLVADPDALARFEREAKSVAALSHPNILAIHDFGRAGATVYAVMELLEGETLREKLATPLPQRKALDYALQLAQGLVAAHERGIVHRDLKPENVFATRDGLVKILDFGLAKPMAASGPMDGEAPTAGGTRPGWIIGTAGYMSPEQARGAPADHRSDLFSFGAILYEMLSGEPAFRREGEVESLIAVIRDQPPALSRPGRPVGPELEDFVLHCLEKRPEERFQSARDLAFALRVLERETAVAHGRSDAVLTGSGAGPSAASVAVLPFRNMSADQQNEYFSDGMTEEIINALSAIRALKVTARTSSFAFKGRDEDVRQIGAALGVRHVLEGSVRQAGRKLRVTAQLIDVSNGYHLWSEKFDREMEDVFAVQDEIARAIAETLKVRLLPAEEARLAARGTENVEAYNHYLKGRYHFNRREPPEAIAEFERALEMDPGYVEAHTGLADSYCIHGFYGGIPTLEAFARARASAEKARRLDPDSADAHVSLGLVEHYYGWDFDRQERELRRAMELAPRSAAAYSWLGLCLAFRQRSQEALELTRKAAELEPLSANAQANVAWCFFGARRMEEAATEFRRALHIDPAALYPLWALGLTCQLLGRHEESLASMRKAVELSGGRQTYYLALLAGACAAAGRRSEALDLVRDLESRSSQQYVAPYHLAFAHVPLGNTTLALDCLARACEERNALAWWVRDSAVFDPIRPDPRFPAVLRKIVPA
ncbi:MAG: protein kinase [Acidobacteria bacterium]|nr:protein kinase [Acidobacteriota bacterium]MCA1612386.1 protein kinase [Acidobacteriota bacterium]